MFHEHRLWAVTLVSSPEELADKLANHSWTLCTAFELDGYLFLNDATGEDGAQEYAVVKRTGPDGHPWQIESITASWMDFNRLLQFVCEALAGVYDREPSARPLQLRIEPAAQHHRCRHCT